MPKYIDQNTPPIATSSEDIIVTTDSIPSGRAARQYLFEFLAPAPRAQQRATSQSHGADSDTRSVFEKIPIRPLRAKPNSLDLLTIAIPPPPTLPRPISIQSLRSLLSTPRKDVLLFFAPAGRWNEAPRLQQEAEIARPLVRQVNLASPCSVLLMMPSSGLLFDVP